MTSDPSQRPVSPLRARMIEDMTVHGFNERTRRTRAANVAVGSQNEPAGGRGAGVAVGAISER